MESFSPLFIGAMVATPKERISSLCHVAFSPLFIGAMVATPIILEQGQWVRSFSPLFIGAMVATHSDIRKLLHLGSPFSPLFIGAMVATVLRVPLPDYHDAFSPLFIGAMVATAKGVELHISARRFQSPFHRGNGCYFFSHSLDLQILNLSVPFSSGQWLLRGWSSL